MVLADLGQSLAAAMHKLNSNLVVDEAMIDECVKDVCAALLRSDVNIKIVQTLRKDLKVQLQEGAAASGNKRRFCTNAIVSALTKMLTPEQAPFKPVRGKRNVIMFVGLQGFGKTTTCAKFAHHYARQRWKVALVCADTFRAGAFDQLKQNAAKVRIPFYGSYTETDPVQIAEDGVKKFEEEGYEIIIVDTSGRHKQESALFEEMKQVQEVVNADDIVFVMDSHIGQACFEQAKAFHDAVPIGSVIVTKMDGNAKGGGALSAIAATGAPIIFLGLGEHFEDFQEFEPQSFVRRLMGLGDISGLTKQLMEAAGPDAEEKSEAMGKRIMKGQFTLRDLYDQLKTISSMGPMSNIMSMIPGMAPGVLPDGTNQMAADRLKFFMTIMDSMTDAELDCEKGTELDKSESRVLRIARGSGRHIEDVHGILAEHKRFSKLIVGLGKTGMLDQDPAAMKRLQRNPQQAMAKLQSVMDPQMMQNMQRMGGAGGMMKMFQEMNMAEMQQNKAIGDAGDAEGGPSGSPKFVPKQRKKRG